MEPQEIVEFATAAAFKKLFTEGDATDTSIEEVLKTIKK
jgi:2-dehydro-3-deoxygluconokinase